MRLGCAKTELLFSEAVLPLAGGVARCWRECRGHYFVLGRPDDLQSLSPVLLFCDSGVVNRFCQVQ